MATKVPRVSWLPRSLIKVRSIRGPNCCDASVSVTITTEKTTPTTVISAPASDDRICLAASGEPLITHDGSRSSPWKAASSMARVTANSATAAALSMDAADPHHEHDRDLDHQPRVKLHEGPQHRAAQDRRLQPHGTTSPSTSAGNFIDVLDLADCRFEYGKLLGQPPRLEPDGSVTTRYGHYPVDQSGLPQEEVELRTFSNGQYVGRFMLTPKPGARPSRRARLVAVALADLAGHAAGPSTSEAA